MICDLIQPPIIAVSQHCYFSYNALCSNSMMAANRQQMRVSKNCIGPILELLLNCFCKVYDKIVVFITSICMNTIPNSTGKSVSLFQLL